MATEAESRPRCYAPNKLRELRVMKRANAPRRTTRTMEQPGGDVDQSMQLVPLPVPARAGARDSDLPERLIVATKRRIRARDLPKDASVIRVLAARDFKVKYKQSLLGPLWLVF